MSTIAHLVVGPAGHGVVEVALATARGRVVAVPTLADLPADAFGGIDVVHTHYTDRLFGNTVESAAAAFTELISSLGRPVTVTLHDLPLPSHEPVWRQRREQAYRRISAAAAGIVVSSGHEAAVIPGQVIPLPVDRLAEILPRPKSTGEVGVLGWIYPGKGHAEVLAALPPTSRMAALGSVSPGHEDLALQLTAAAHGRLRLTGYLSEDALRVELARIGVPIAPNHNVSASASVGTWLGAGRRPLVADGPWARELDSRCPGAIALYPRGRLAEVVGAALEDPGSTWLGDTPVGPSSDQVATALETFIRGVL